MYCHLYQTTTCSERTCVQYGRDEENKSGGKWIVRLKKGVSDRYWEDLLLAIIGDQFGEAGEEICGAVLSVRNGEDILSVWMRADGGRVLRIRYGNPQFLFVLKRTWTSTKLTYCLQRNNEATSRVPARHEGGVEEP